MGGAVKSAGGFLGLGSGPQVGVQSGNQGLDDLNQQNSISGDPGAMQLLQGYSQGANDSNGTLQQSQSLSPEQQQGFMNALATGATTGSKYATDQVQNNGILGGLFGKDGQLNQAESKLTDLNNQGFELKPEDMTLYGQTSGNIARMFGQQGNQMSQDLASRGLASAPSGAAGAMFSGLAGNQNEMLANAQQQIMQQRFQNTQNQIAQQQNFVSQMGQQGANAINQQYGRQLSGAQNQTQGLEQASGLQNQANAGANQANLGAANFDQANKPVNFMDYASAGAGTRLNNMASGNNGNAGMFGQNTLNKTPSTGTT